MQIIRTRSETFLFHCVVSLQDGESKRIEEFLQRRNETLINIDFRDAETGNTAIIWAAKRGHVKV